MSGIYLHIPFCKKACHYCNFHFSTNLSLKKEMVDAICKELDLRAHELQETIETIYFGGGTPSVLSPIELEQIFSCINKNFKVSKQAEISLEANPDDLTTEVLKKLYDSPINRLSIGVQSFFEEDLVAMNRSHNHFQAHQCIEDSQSIGFHNFSIDLIYGLTSSNLSKWEENLEKVFNYQIPHLSCYALTVEEKTALAHFIEKGKMQGPREEEAAEQFQHLAKASKAQGYEHYEISNLAKDKKYSKHNTAYWQGKKYLGVGPAAHSYDGESRKWNVAHNPNYLKYINAWKNETEKNLEGHLYDIEKLTEEDRYNEYIMTSLRTIWGIDERHLQNNFNARLLEHFETSAQSHIQKGSLIKKEGKYLIEAAQRFFADGIASDLFWT